ncbi:M48 family metallopeptidase [Bremerella sp. P1]|uniref:M48 family metallopeptidase n=1 Tax=Bremerella sp. P1 TaxID=3026424 RepID=UPI0023681369|nr:SprT family zinc-dependent metalloprotease [Bremerella sp. P1]WDI39857.1 SprT family zinc-dependent metalloprotease [Bremerella sp. P1]
MTNRNGHATRRMTTQFGRKRIDYELSYSTRKTLAIDVHPDLSVVVTAPKDASDSAVEGKMQKRASWIIQQQRFFETYLPAIPPRRYISGESHRYLGRQYRLRVHKSDEDAVKMARGQINVYLTDPNQKGRIKSLVVGWFRQRAKIIFQELFDEMAAKASRHGIEAGSFRIQRMKNRWGSCTKEGRILLNPDLIIAPKQCIEYVIVHELCHLQEHNHGPRFYRLLKTLMPDWEQRRNRLNVCVVGA